MTRRYVMCFTVHYQKKTWQKKNSNGLSQTAHLTWRSSLERISWAHCGVFGLSCGHVSMFSHVIPCYPKMAKRRKYGNWNFWDYPNHPILSRVAISSHLVTSKNGQTLPRRDANILVHLGPMLQVLQIAGTLPRVHSRGVTIHGGNLCNFQWVSW